MMHASLCKVNNVIALVLNQKITVWGLPTIMLWA